MATAFVKKLLLIIGLTNMMVVFFFLLRDRPKRAMTQGRARKPSVFQHLQMRLRTTLGFGPPKPRRFPGNTTHPLGTQGPRRPWMNLPDELPRGTPSRLRDLECSARLVLFVVLWPRRMASHDRQLFVINSWHKLNAETLTLVLLVTEDSAASLAHKHNSRYFRVPATVDGLPHADAVLDFVQTSCKEAVVALTHGLVGLGDARRFLEATEALRTFDWHEQLVVTAPIFRAFKGVPGNTSGWLAVAASPNPQPGGLRSVEWHDFWMWNMYPSCPPLTDAAIPPFWFGMPEFGAWFLGSAVETASRHVINLNGMLGLMHPHSPPQPQLHLQRPRSTASTGLTSYATYINERLLFRPYLRRSGNGGVLQHSATFGRVQEVPWKLKGCRRIVFGSQACLEAQTVRLNYGPWNALPPLLQGRVRCNRWTIAWGHCASAAAVVRNVSLRAWALRQVLPTEADTSGFVGSSIEQWPFTFDAQLEKQATRQKQVVLTAGNAGFIPYLWNFVCNLLKLNVSHFVIAALDKRTFDWGVSRGLPVFLWSLKDGEILFAQKYGTRNYERLTKTKPEISAAALQKGYSVFFVDPDVVVFRNPLHLIDPAQAHIMHVQSDEKLLGEPDRLPEQVPAGSGSHDRLNRAMNSGFYYAPSTKPAIEAFQKIAYLVTTEEGVKQDGDQPLFNRVLCEPPNGQRVSGDKCLVKFGDGELELRFWPQMVVANGWTSVGTEKGESLYNWTHHGLEPRVPGMVAIHNNYITGMDRKISRQMRAGLWFLSRDGMCQI